MADGNIGATEGGVGGAMIMGGIWLGKWVLDRWWTARRTPQQKATDAAGLDKQSVETAAALMKGMREDLDALREVVRELQTSHQECEDRCTALSGEVRKLQAANEAQGRLLAQLRDPAATNRGGPIEGAIFELAGGEITDVSGRPLIKGEKE